MHNQILNDQRIANEELQAELKAKEKQLREEIGDEFSEEHESMVKLREEQKQLNLTFENQLKDHTEAKAEALS